MRDVGGGFVLGRFWSGASFAASGIRLTLRHRKLLVWSIVPMIVQALIFAALVAFGLYFAGDLVDRFRPDAGHWYSFIGSVLYVAAVVLVVIGAVVGSLFLGGAVCDPFYDALSEATEAILLGREVSSPFSVPGVVRGILRELVALVWMLAAYAAVALPLWLLSLTGVGSVVTVPLSLMWTWMFVAYAGLQRAMARHAVPGAGRLGAVFGVRSLSLGFGAVGWLMSHVPLTYPFLVVGGTRLYLALAAYDRVQSTLTDADKRALCATSS